MNSQSDIPTDLIYILDRSGSMQPLLEEAVSGLKAFIKENQAVPGECYFTLVLFDNEIKTPLFRGNIHEVNVDKIQYGTFSPQDPSTISINAGGSTSLRDAIGISFAKFDPAWNVAAFIMTDGEENSSKEWTAEALKTLVKERTEGGWNINFVGVGIDAFTQNAGLGIAAAQTSNVPASVDGLKSMNTSYLKAAYSTRGVI